MTFRILSCAVLGVAMAGPVTAQDISLVVNCFLPPQHFLCTELLPGWLEQVETVTEGRVSGLILPTSAAPPTEQLAAVEAGQMDVAVQFNGLIPTQTIGARVAMVPFSGGATAEQNSAALWRTTSAFFAGEFSHVELLSQFVIAPVQIYSLSDQPVTSLADLESRRVWALPGPLAAIGAAIDAGVVATPAVESRDIISRGVVDASIGPEPETVRSMQLIPYMRSMTTFSQPLYNSSFSLLMNAATWARISAADQEAIRSVSGESFARSAGAAWDSTSAEVLATFATAGIVSVEADAAFEAELREASAFLRENWLTEAAAAGFDGQAALDFYQTQAGQ